MIRHLLSESRRQLERVDHWDFKGITDENAGLVRTDLMALADEIDRIRSMLYKELEEQNNG